MKSLLKYLPVLALCAAVSCRTGHEGPAYLDKSLSPEERAADLLKRLTLEEKGTLMKNKSEAVPRLGIKAYNWWNEALHGVARNGSATVFPQPVGMAASFDEPLVYEVFTAVSDEARVKNRLAAMEGDPDIYQGLTFWTPNINLFRDPRWGRGMETYGEDPYLTGQLGMAVVRGLQGAPHDGWHRAGRPGKQAGNIQKAHACAKHFAVHSGPEPLRHTFNATCSDRDLHETYLPAFKDLVTKAGVEEVMAAYNAFRGKPCAVNDYLIDTLLRKEWGFKGIITTDCHGIEDLYTNHHWSKDTLAAISDAVNNGIDLECGNHFQHLAEAVARGDEDQATIDKALFRLLTARFRLGEMDRESPWDNLPEEIVESPAHLELSRKMARESLVLLQNRNDVLPLPEDARVALIGPNRDNVEMMWGNYNPVPYKTVTLLEGLQERFPDLRSFDACGIADTLIAPGTGTRVMTQKNLMENLGGVDYVIFAGGISARFEGEEMKVEVPGFGGGDRSSIELPAVQRQVLQWLREAGKKVILVNFSGSAMGLVPETESCDAILQAWYPGQEGGHAIADVLLGDCSPSGKLPVTFYRNVDQLPPFEDYAMEGHTYRFFRGEPLFPFGFGLGYTPVDLSDVRLKGVRTNGLSRNACVEVTLANRGDREQDEVIQLYLRRPDDPEGPQKTLRGFVRVKTQPGKTVKARLPLSDETFNWWDPAIRRMRPLSGDYELLVGTSSRNQDLHVIPVTF